MAHIVGIVGKSGNGKSHGIQFLNPKTTIVINADRKPMPFKAWGKEWNSENRNYLETSSPSLIKKVLKSIDKDEPYKHIKTIVIDTANAIMVDDEMRRASEQNFDKWLDLAVAVYDIINIQQAMRRDIVCFTTFHEESFLDDDGIRTTRILTNGKKLNKINLASRITTILWSKVECEEGGKNRHYFQTKKDNNEAKSPEGMFDTFEIENNYSFIEEAVRAYDGI